ncbi:hypothetical protein B0H12DRAFT_1136429 [Mycena haematopus]|nr:hypothetical protein B0H12DRAFT_1136429 [Mycena haematopus]
MVRETPRASVLGGSRHRRQAVHGPGNDLVKKRSSPSSPQKVVLEVPLSRIDGSIIRLDILATPGHLRLLDCNAFLDKHVLRVLEFSEFNPQALRYAAVSYPWRDLQLPDGAQPLEGCFGVHGAEHADPITVSVLRTACVAARHFGASLLWLDRLSMIQSSKEDKVWQIERMYTIYVHCNPCIVLPGGLVRLARPDEPTTWLDRAWTLQEAAASLHRDGVKCVFSFPYSHVDELRQSLGLLQLHIVEDILEPGNSAFCSLNELFRDINRTFSMFESMYPPEFAKDPRNFPVRFISPPAARLETTRYTNHTRCHQYFWMSAFSRSSSRAVDMIFSIMGPLGVTLDVAQFQADDRLKATIKLIQATLRDGHPADWLFTAPELPPSRELSLLPVFPETSVSGCAMLQAPDGRIPAFEAIAREEPWSTSNSPKGQMDDDGYFCFSAKAARCLESHAGTTVVDGDVWAVIIGSQEDREWKGPKRNIPHIKVVEMTFMFIEKHGVDNRGELFHRVGMERTKEDTSRWAWVERDFVVGGPGRGHRVRFVMGQDGPCRGKHTSRRLGGAAATRRHRGR